jgi:D-alanine-D-alanine ligase
LKAIDRRKFEVVPIGINKAGHWLTSARRRGGNGSVKKGCYRRSAGAIRKLRAKPKPSAIDSHAALGGQSLDVVFPVLHGTFGEDGTIQGLFELAGIAYVGSGVLGSAAGMDKDVMKRLFAQAKLPIVRHVTLLRAEWEKSPRKAVAQVEAALKYPVFVKPANLGSSVGISKVHDRKELGPALTLAAKYDRKLVVEQGVGGKKAKARELRSRCWATTIPGERGGRDRSRQGVLRLRGQVSFRRLGPGDSGQAEPRGDQADSRDGRGGVSRLRPQRPGAGGLSDGAGRQAAHLSE